AGITGVKSMEFQDWRPQGAGSPTRKCKFLVLTPLGAGRKMHDQNNKETPSKKNVGRRCPGPLARSLHPGSSPLEPVFRSVYPCVSPVNPTSQGLCPGVSLLESLLWSLNLGASISEPQSWSLRVA